MIYINGKSVFDGTDDPTISKDIVESSSVTEEDSTVPVFDDVAFSD